ncbi:tripartite tricarboxylate transporter TctB family protein [Streptomyces himalayensis]|uniref:Tripartite tricarboxylate transporter TctB family protein n=1 Tax=Streptomyces himalayensis subsp. himalayensis TaxID=2756131 RepID=A0A7W0DIL9_9ACTN|nr:tripartite tricarboxylate transporter TctB family protein [Streptomyces himalayensis]MBA2945791.1 tripartite tricarboxylate transporter TctB family protein [Streptomyces himalayensis subsp. himalayensis]
MSTPAGTERPARRRPVLVAYCVLAAVGGAFFLGSFAYPWTNPEDGTIGAGALPRVAGLLMFVLSLALIRQETGTGSVLEGDGHVAETAEHTPEEARRIRAKLLVVTLTMAATALLIPVLGMLPALTVMTLFLTAVVERLPLPRAAAVSAGVFGVSYLLFIVVLQVPLPFGLFDATTWSVL